MSSELPLQTKIIKSVKKDGGYARKMSNRFAIGVPDLLIGLWPWAPCLAEVKDMGVCVDNFDRQIGITDKQSLELERFSQNYEQKQTIYTPDCHTGFILVGILHRNEHRLVALPRAAERLDAGYEADPARWVKRGVGGYYDVKPLLEWAGICKVRLM